MRKAVSACVCSFMKCKFMAASVRALCRCGIRIPSARNRCPAFDKDKCLEPMFGDVGQARTNAAMLILMIDTTSSRTCTKPIVTCSTFSQEATCHKDEAFSIVRLRFFYTPSYSLFANRKAGEA